MVNGSIHDTNSYRHAQEQLRLSQINISGLSQKSILALDQYIEELNIDICAVQESFSSKLPSFQNCVFLDMKRDPNSNANVRGVSLIIKNTLLPQRLTNLESGDVQSVWASANWGKSERCVIGSIYCKPDTTQTEFQKILHHITAAKTYCISQGIQKWILLGDFNARSKQWGDKNHK